MVAALLVPVAAWVFGKTRPTWGWTVAYPAVVIAYLAWYASRVPGPWMGWLLWGNPWQALAATVQNLVMTLIPLGRNTVGDVLWSGRGTAGALVVTGVVGLGVLIALALKNGDRVSVYGWLWAVVAFIPTCRFPWGERYAYLPAVGLALVAAAGLNRLRSRRTTAVTVVIVAVLVIFAIGSILSATFWTVGVGRF